MPTDSGALITQGVRMIKALRKSVVLILALSTFSYPAKIPVSFSMPVTGMVEEASKGKFITNPASSIFLNDYLETDSESRASKALNEFVSSVADGQSEVIRGLFVDEKIAFQVIQQPAGQLAYVSSAEDVITEFAMARSRGVVGMLAHNYLAGKFFSDIQMDDIIQVVYGDGQIQKYHVVDIQRYQALQPNSTNSEFIDLDTTQRLTATQLFNKVYTGDHHVTLQTCIQVGEVDTWGRLFIIAEPIS